MLTPKDPKYLQPPLKLKKNRSIFGVYGTQNDQFGFNAAIGFEKYAPGPEISSKTCQKAGFQTKPAYFLDILANTSGPGACFFIPIFGLRP